MHRNEEQPPLATRGSPHSSSEASAAIKKKKNTTVENITSHLLEWLLQKKKEREITSVG